MAFRSPAALPGIMALRPLKWILANQFQHARSFIGPSLEHECVPTGLRERIELRIRAGKRLLLLRVILVVVLFAGVGVLTSVIADWISGPAALFLWVLTILVPILAAPAILLVTRSIKLLETDIHILAAEVVARCHAAQGPMPSGYAVVLRKRRK